MKPSTIAIAAGFVAVALIGFLIGRSGPAGARRSSPATGGPVPVLPPPVGTHSAKSQPKRGPATTQQPTASTTADAPRVKAQTYTNPKLHVSLEKPGSTDWAMTDDRRSFRDPVRHKAKVLEIRREPKGPNPQFAIIELYVLDAPAGTNDAAEVDKLEKLGQRAKFGTFRVVEEKPVTVKGRSMVRRVTLWDATGTPLAAQSPLIAQSKFISVRARHRGKLYVLIGTAPATYFDALVPEFEQALTTMRID